jgi:hypothetical protein
MTLAGVMVPRMISLAIVIFITITIIVIIIVVVVIALTLLLLPTRSTPRSAASAAAYHTGSRE